MYTGTSLVERVRRIVEREVHILETWLDQPGDQEGLSEPHLKRLETIAKIVKQLDLDSVEPEQAQPGVPKSDAPLADLLAQLPKK